jgi:hypothetical protein
VAAVVPPLLFDGGDRCPSNCDRHGDERNAGGRVGAGARERRRIENGRWRTVPTPTKLFCARRSGPAACKRQTSQLHHSSSVLLTASTRQVTRAGLNAQGRTHSGTGSQLDAVPQLFAHPLWAVLSVASWLSDAEQRPFTSSSTSTSTDRSLHSTGMPSSSSFPVATSSLLSRPAPFRAVSSQLPFSQPDSSVEWRLDPRAQGGRSQHGDGSPPNRNEPS